MAKENIGYGVHVTTQTPLDTKTIQYKFSSIISLGVGNEKIFSYYENMVVNCLENKKSYLWSDVTKAPSNYILVSTIASYPANHIVDGIDYSLRQFGMYEIVVSSGTVTQKDFKVVNTSDGQPAVLNSATLVDKTVDTPSLKTTGIRRLRSSTLFFNTNELTGEVYIDNIRKIYPWMLSGVIIKPDLSTGYLPTFDPSGTILVKDYAQLADIRNNPEFTVAVSDRVNVKFDSGNHLIKSDFADIMKNINAQDFKVSNSAVVQFEPNAKLINSPNGNSENFYSLDIDAGGSFQMRNNSIVLENKDNLSITGTGLLMNEDNSAGYGIVVNNVNLDREALTFKDVDIIKTTFGGIAKTFSNVGLTNVHLITNTKATPVFDIVNSNVSMNNVSVNNESIMMRSLADVEDTDKSLFEFSGDRGSIDIVNSKLKGNSIIVDIPSEVASVEVNVSNSDLKDAKGLLVRAINGSGVNTVNTNNNQLVELTISQGIPVTNIKSTNDIVKDVIVSILPQRESREAAVASGLPEGSLFINTKGSVDKPIWILDVVLAWT